MEDKKNKLPIDFDEITQEEIDKLDSYKRVTEYERIDLLIALVDSESDEEEE